MTAIYKPSWMQDTGAGAGEAQVNSADESAEDQADAYGISRDGDQPVHIDGVDDDVAYEPAQQPAAAAPRKRLRMSDIADKSADEAPDAPAPTQRRRTPKMEPDWKPATRPTIQSISDPPRAATEYGVTQPNAGEYRAIFLAVQQDHARDVKERYLPLREAVDSYNAALAEEHVAVRAAADQDLASGGVEALGKRLEKASGQKVLLTTLQDYRRERIAMQTDIDELDGATAQADAALVRVGIKADEIERYKLEHQKEILEAEKESRGEYVEAGKAVVVAAAESAMGDAGGAAELGSRTGNWLARAFYDERARDIDARISYIEHKLKANVSQQLRAELKAAQDDLVKARKARLVAAGHYAEHHYAAQSKLGVLASYERDAGTGTMFQEAHRSWIRMTDEASAVHERSSAYLAALTGAPGHYHLVDGDLVDGMKANVAAVEAAIDETHGANAGAYRESHATYADWREQQDFAIASAEGHRDWRAAEEDRQRELGRRVGKGSHFKAIDEACAEAEASLIGTVNRHRSPIRG